MTTGVSSALFAERANDVELPLGRLLCVDPIDPELPPDLVGDRCAIAGHHRNVPDADQPQTLDKLGSVLAQGVSHHDRPGEPAIHADEDFRLAQITVRIEPACRVLGAGVAALAQPHRAADGDAPAIDTPLDPLPAALHDLRGRGELEAAVLRRVHERFCEHVRGQLVDGGGQTQQLVGADPVERDDPLERGMPERQRAGLVEQHRACLAELLDHAAALDDHAAPRGARDARDQRNRGGQDQRTRGGDDHHGDEADRVSRRRPGDPGDREREREKEGGIAVGQADEWRALLLGAADEAHDRRVGALGGEARRAQVERRHRR